MTIPVAVGAREAGASLVELVVSLSVGGLVLALSLNGQSLLANRRLTGIARTLATDIRMVEQRARTERTCYRLVFDPAQDAYRIDRYAGTVTAAPPGGGSQCTDTAPGSWITGLFKDESAGAGSRQMPRGVDLVSTTFGGNTLLFSPMGNPNAGRARMQTASGQVREVVVEVMGRVRIGP